MNLAGTFRYETLVNTVRDRQKFLQASSLPQQSLLLFYVKIYH